VECESGELLFAVTLVCRGSRAVVFHFEVKLYARSI
jgi:hypothetical protein